MRSPNWWSSSNLRHHIDSAHLRIHRRDCEHHRAREGAVRAQRPSHRRISVQGIRAGTAAGLTPDPGSTGPSTKGTLGYVTSVVVLDYGSDNLRSAPAGLEPPAPM